ncbi:type I restriction enzyme R subunit [Flavobacterium sp. 9]|uniref:type I restriction endonuclease subunit R n=1 Tax=Flavobacterium sp. 9 TaxID=2035198 RepID=UPI000C1A24B2|nr:type I restriction endonuclease [Flavobacterium sp. 9]PIF34542.1 type I restriction enzyme R subunit [Flavobacterium sp. 9]
MNINSREAAFENIIESSLLQRGYTSLERIDYDTEKALYPRIIIEFIRTTQLKEWSKLENLLGNQIEDQVISDLCRWIELHGSLSTLRHGFKCYGRLLQVAYFKASHTMNVELDSQYKKNILGITRQLQYSKRNSNSLDTVLSINGIPIITLELKNPLTLQTVEHAKRQYKMDRDPRELLFEFKKRALVHFAVDTENVFMTTRLAGDATYFLPFNKGNEGGAGNPHDKFGNNYRTAYLWEEILQADSLLELISRFIHMQVEEKLTDEGRKIKKETLVFPRYHQLDAVRKIIDVAFNNGVGNNYLIEHSAGSGKSNTIAWLSHRLASLHNAQNNKVFDSVIVITDRVVLDKQLQDNIYQFEHKRGVVEKIDVNSRQLAEALENSIPIIITTLQKFPFVSQQLLKMAEEKGEKSNGLLKTKKFAVIIDEAHSSQTGETATDLKEVLGGEDLVNLAKEKALSEEIFGMEELYRSMAKRGKQSNISFFAFTGTPKHKTLKIFGANNKPFHKYTMRQAIEEGFIMDVLKNYTTYKTYYKLLKAGQNDPNVERKKAAQALTRFLKLHPHNISQKTEVMIEHFYSNTYHKIGGHAKAMVVTGSRLEAVRYKQSFDKYIKNKNYDIKSLVAFSGIVNDNKNLEIKYSEEQMNNGIREKELPEIFATSGYHVLLVAEKYQTGFDQPLLHSMYIDRRLSGIQAVQTLSRLNRIHPLKEDTFILDFVNDPVDIQNAFKAYYEGAEIGEEVDPANLYRLQNELHLSQIYFDEDISNFCDIYFKPKQKQSILDHQLMNAALDPSVSRFIKMHQENEFEAELWKNKLNSFRTLYVFLSQIIPYQDSDLEKLFIFLRYLAPKLPRRDNGENYNFDDSVRLEYYRLQKISEGSISLMTNEKHFLNGPMEIGTGKVIELEVPFSKLIDVVNERFGTDFNQADQYFFDQLIESAILDATIIKAAEVNPEDKFELVFKNLLQNLFMERIDQNEVIFSKFMNDSRFQKVVTNWLSNQAYNKIKQIEKI